MTDSRPNALEFISSSAPPAQQASEQMTCFVPSEDQAVALDQIRAWYALAKTGSSKKMEFKQGGYAGTGKTTITKEFISKMLNVAVCAFTGKAADVLNRKGVRGAQTIHSLIYECEEDPVTHELHFFKKPRIFVPLIVVDESSMLSTELYADLRSYRIPLLFVGDPGQLEPVGDNPNLMKTCDNVLQTIHRQAMESPIIELATAIRLSDGTKKPHLFQLKANKGDVKFTNKRLAMDNFDPDVDQVICARNATRNEYNKRYRAYHKMEQGIAVGEKLICLQNNRKLNVFNGQTLFVDSIKSEDSRAIKCMLREDRPNAVPKEYWVWSDPFYRKIEKGEKCPTELVYCDYGYCVTCHKSQGSEWKHVMLIDEWMPAEVWDMRRWRYTGITRAAEKLTYACL